MNNYSPKLMITGGTGQLAEALRHHPYAQHFQMVFCSHAELDVTDGHAVDEVINTIAPDIVINTAAYTAVDKAEHEAYQAMRINYQGVKHLSLACAKQHSFLIHVSTDYIFDGKQTMPYQEEDAPNPINVYGESKWLGEQAVRDYCEKHIILRTSGLFSEYGKNFFKTMLRLANTQKSMRIVADQISCPTDATHLASVILTIAEKPYTTGTYHYCDAKPTTWHQFAVDIIRAARNRHPVIVDEVKAITTAEYPTDAKRPAYSVLQCSKIARDFGIVQQNRENAIQRIVSSQQLEEDYV